MNKFVTGLKKCSVGVFLWAVTVATYAADNKFVMKLNGEDAKIENNDVIAFLLNIGKAGVGVLFGGACLYALWHVANGVWHKWGDWLAGRAELKELAAPAVLGVFLLVMTFGLAYYASSSFTNIMG